MAFIRQYDIDMQRQGQANKFADGLPSAIGMLEENRQRALAEKRAQESDERQGKIQDEQIKTLQHQNAQNALPYDQRDAYKQARGVELLKQQRLASNKGNDLDIYEAKQKIKNKYKDTQNDESVSKAAQTKIIQNNVGLANVKSAMDSALQILEDPAIPEDQKVKTGQGLYKLLNSAEGADAVGAEEAKRIGSYLEYHIGNFTQPGAFIGRDVPGFVGQIKNYSTLLGDRIKRNETTAAGLKQGKPISEMVSNHEQPQRQPSQISPEDQAALQWANANRNDPRAIQILQLHGVK